LHRIGRNVSPVMLLIFQGGGKATYSRKGGESYSLIARGLALDRSLF